MGQQLSGTFGTPRVRLRKLLNLQKRHCERLPEVTLQFPFYEEIIPVIITISGKRNVGKDVFTDILMERLQEHYGCHQNNPCDGRFMHRFAFEDPLKQIVCDTFNVDRAWIKAWRPINSPPPGFDQPVEALLDYVAGLQKYKQTLWTTLLLDKLPKTGIVLITDVKLGDDLRKLKAIGATTILVTRQDYCDSQDHTDDIDDSDVRRDFDHIVSNNGSIAALKENAYLVLEHISNILRVLEKEGKDADEKAPSTVQKR